MPSIRETFRTQGDEPVTLILAVGDAQIGGFSTFHNGVKIAPTTADESTARYELGDGSRVRLTDLNSQIIVKDVSPGTDHTSLSVTVSQGGRKAQYSMRERAPTGGTVDYAISLWFE